MNEVYTDELNVDEAQEEVVATDEEFQADVLPEAEKNVEDSEEAQDAAEEESA